MLHVKTGTKDLSFFIQGKRVSHDTVTLVKDSPTVRRMFRDKVKDSKTGEMVPCLIDTKAIKTPVKTESKPEKSSK